MKPSVILPAICGVVIGAALFILGAADDAPGLSLMGIVAAFLLIMWSISNVGFIKKNQLAYILPLCLGAGCLIMSVVLQLDGEFEEMPGMFLTGLLLGAALILFGLINKRRRKA